MHDATREGRIHAAARTRRGAGRWGRGRAPPAPGAALRIKMRGAFCITGCIKDRSQAQFQQSESAGIRHTCVIDDPRKAALRVG